jgi:hypothetical protein
MELKPYWSNLMHGWSLQGGYSGLGKVMGSPGMVLLLLQARRLIPVAQP